MKKLKLLIPTLAMTIGGCIAPTLVSCSNTIPTDIVITGESSVYLASSSEYKAYGLLEGKQIELENVVWSVEDPAGRTGSKISNNGCLTAGHYTGTINVVAQWTDSKTGTIISKKIPVTLVSPIHSIVIDPIEVERFHPNDDPYQFSATIDAIEGMAGGCIWRVEQSSTSAYITEEGLFYPGEEEGQVKIIAQSEVDHNIKAECTVDIAIGPIISFEVIGNDGIIIGEQATYQVKLEVEKIIEDKSVRLEFDDGETGATFNTQTLTIDTTGATPGKAVLKAIPNCYPEGAISFDVYIDNSFATYQVIDEAKKTAKLTSFNTNVGSFGHPILSPTCEIDGVKYTITEIGDYVFKDNKKITEVELPSTVERICQHAFLRAGHLTKFVIPENSQLNFISFCGLEGTGIKSFVAPSKLAEIASSGLCWNSDLEFADLSKATQLKYLANDLFDNCHSLKQIKLPENGELKTFKGDCFAIDWSLVDINIPKTVETFEYNCFMNCTSLKQITLPASTKTIGPNILGGCTSLTDIYYDGTVSDWELITKDSNWCGSNPVEVVHCNGGDVPIVRP